MENGRRTADAVLRRRETEQQNSIALGRGRFMWNEFGWYGQRARNEKRQTLKPRMGFIFIYMNISVSSVLLV